MQIGFVNWFLDVWLPTKCLLCAKPPRQLCEGCKSLIATRPRLVSRLGLVGGVAAVDYRADAKALVHHLKVLGAGSVSKHMARHVFDSLERLQAIDALQAARGKVYLVPVPSRPEITRVRGFVPSALLARRLERCLLETGVRAQVKPIARLGRQVRDQAGLNRQEREENLNGAMRATGPATPEDHQVAVWMVDDVITTGASLRELQRCLLGQGWNVQGFVTFAETL